ncbi:sensor domain-containing diguanylate cyclase [Amycolatopsis sp. H20-H5]|uniref:sensor domain-containing diguanylate cyclase n=1 Tax=Amycolatopsis sp. H20-H5 TaxID=3046309 RepID=UPI002DBDA70E|nr:GGDEF domain-containing protein [Amycolatopsis sp. H20-H5]MEC3978899.1 GGDEF domain-containing protein [Amycolatopsis sp. H20-H5]
MTGEDNVSKKRQRIAAKGATWPTNWALWELPHRVIAFVVCAELTTVALTVVLATWAPVSSGNPAHFLVLLALGLLAAETTCYIERTRRQLSDTPHVNMSSVWILAVTLLTTPILGAATAAILYLHLWWRTWRWVSGVTKYRAVFNTTVMILSAYAAAGIAAALSGQRLLQADHPQQLVGLVVVIGTFWAVNSVLVAGVIGLAEGERSWGRLLGNWSDNALECVTLCIGALTAALAVWRPWLILLVLPTVYVLHRSVQVKHLEEAATTDRKTGLYNSASWNALAEQGLAKATRPTTPVAVLMLDLDHFKAVNDTYGHLVGDQVLRAVAEVIRRQVRKEDLAGRFGGEEFVVYLPEANIDTATRVAERIMKAIRELRFDESSSGASLDKLRLTVSIGVAGYPNAGEHLPELLLAADNALFSAKQAGRDRVRVVGNPPIRSAQQQDDVHH